MNVYTSVHNVQSVQIQTDKTAKGNAYTTLRINASDSSYFDLILHHEPGKLQFDISELPTQAIVDRKQS